jgi:hypothetical protein
MTPEQIKAAAVAWYEGQLAKLELRHGARWVDNQQWVREYLSTELRLRLIARGWGVER